MVFGTFDGLHEGHRFFLREAKKHGEYLIVVVAPDSVVEKLKNRSPRAPHSVRRAALLAEHLADEIVFGDETLGSWNVLTSHTPDIICLGHDQESLSTALQTWVQKNKSSIKLIRLTKA